MHVRLAVREANKRVVTILLILEESIRYLRNLYENTTLFNTNGVPFLLHRVKVNGVIVARCPTGTGELMGPVYAGNPALERREVACKRIPGKQEWCSNTR